MVAQLRCRELVERLSAAQRALPGGLLRRAMEVGAISWQGAIERLGRMTFVTRHAVVRSLLEVFPDDALAALFALVRAPQAGDGAIWFHDEATVTAVAVRLAQAGQADALLRIAAVSTEPVRLPALFALDACRGGIALTAAPRRARRARSGDADVEGYAGARAVAACRVIVAAVASDRYEVRNP